jgi:preprotein translocase subunit SecG
MALFRKSNEEHRQTLSTMKSHGQVESYFKKENIPMSQLEAYCSTMGIQVGGDNATNIQNNTTNHFNYITQAAQAVKETRVCPAQEEDALLQIGVQQAQATQAKEVERNSSFVIFLIVAVVLMVFLWKVATSAVEAVTPSQQTLSSITEVGSTLGSVVLWVAISFILLYLVLLMIVKSEPKAQNHLSLEAEAEKHSTETAKGIIEYKKQKREELEIIDAELISTNGGAMS